MGSEMCIRDSIYIGHLRHDFSPQGKIRWFVYSIEDEPCQKTIIGSTQDPLKRWANHKATCNKKTSKSSGLSKHFMDGCPFDPGIEKTTLSFSLLDYYDTTGAKLLTSGHNKRKMDKYYRSLRPAKTIRKFDCWRKQDCPLNRNCLQSEVL